MIENVRGNVRGERRTKMPITLKELAGIVLIFCAMGLSVAQDENFDPVKEEEILKNACPTSSEIVLPVDEVDRDEWANIYNGDCYTIVYYVYSGYKQLQCPDTAASINTHDWYEVTISLSGENCMPPRYPSEDYFRSHNLFPADGDEVYDGLPGGVINVGCGGSENNFVFTNIECEIDFWKNPQYNGYVSIWVQVHDFDEYGCTPPYEERVAESKISARSECERLAKLMYDRLPDVEYQSPDNKTIKYSELIAVLKEYRPEWFGPDLNPGLTDDIIDQALREHETGPGGMGGVTPTLNNNMMGEIDEFYEELKVPPPSWKKPLVEPAEKSDWENTTNYYYNFLSSIQDYLEKAGVSVPIPIKLLEGAKDLQDNAEHLRDSYFIPDIAEDMYQCYKTKRSRLTQSEAFEETIFESRKWFFGSGWYAVRSSPEFANNDSRTVENILEQRFENRYCIENTEAGKKKMRANSDTYINAIICKYDEKIQHISKRCDEIIEEQKAIE